MAVMFKIDVFWVVIPCTLVVRYHRLSSMLFLSSGWNFVTQPQHYTAS